MSPCQASTITLSVTAWPGGEAANGFGIDHETAATLSAADTERLAGCGGSRLPDAAKCAAIRAASSAWP